MIPISTRLRPRRLRRLHLRLRRHAGRQHAAPLPGLDRDAGPEAGPALRFTESLFYHFGGMPARQIVERLNRDFGYNLPAEKTAHEKEMRFHRAAARHRPGAGSRRRAETPRHGRRRSRRLGRPDRYRARHAEAYRARGRAGSNRSRYVVGSDQVKHGKPYPGSFPPRRGSARRRRPRAASSSRTRSRASSPPRRRAWTTSMCGLTAGTSTPPRFIRACLLNKRGPRGASISTGDEARGGTASGPIIHDAGHVDEAEQRWQNAPFSWPKPSASPKARLPVLSPWLHAPTTGEPDPYGPTGMPNRAGLT